MGSVTTAEAAERLGISRQSVHGLVASGRLVKAGTVGRAALIDTASLELLERTGTRRGRVWTEQTAWGALSLLSGGDADWMKGTHRSHLKARLRGLSAEDVIDLARNRAVVRRFRTTPDVVAALRAHLLPTGTTALADEETATRFGLTEGAGTADGYVMRGDADRLRDGFGLIEGSEGNVTIREVSFAEPFAGGRVPLAAVAADLTESPGTREQSAGRRVLEKLLHD